MNLAEWLSEFAEAVMVLLSDIASSAPVKALGSVIYVIVNGHESVFQALAALMVLDYITGVWCATVQGKYKGTTARKKTLVKFLVYTIIAAAAKSFDIVLEGERMNPFDTQMLSAALVYLAGTELLSIVQNFDGAGHPIRIPLLEKLREWLQPKKPD